MCYNYPFCSMVEPIGLVNMAANHVAQQHQVTITQDARQALAEKIQAAAKIQAVGQADGPDLLTAYLQSQGLSHLDLIHLAEKQFLQGLPYASGAPNPVSALDKAGLDAGIAVKAWSPIWK
jgi:hypothetical protein